MVCSNQTAESLWLFLALSPDAKYLFLLGETKYWVCTSFVEDLKPKQGFTD